MNTYGLIIVVLILVVGMYFLMMRPAKKQQQAQQKMMDSLGPGSRIMTSSGIYGTIRHMGDKQMVIEISPGVDMTILRQAVRSVVTADDDEFEYSDEPDAAPEAADMTAFEQDVNAPFAPEADAAAPEAPAAEAEASEAAPMPPADAEPDGTDEPTDSEQK